MLKVSVPYNNNGESTQRTVQLSLTDHQLGLIDRLAEAVRRREGRARRGWTGARGCRGGTGSSWLGGRTIR